MTTPAGGIEPDRNMGGESAESVAAPGAWRCMQNTHGVWRLYRFHGDGPDARIMSPEPPNTLGMPSVRSAWAAIHAELDALGMRDHAELVVLITRYGLVRFKQGERAALEGGVSRP